MYRKLMMFILSTGMIIGTTVMVSSMTAFGEVRFVAAGDTRGSDNGVNTAILEEIVQATIDENAEFIIVMGDLVNGSSDIAVLESQLTTWRTVMMPLYDNGVGVYPCRGNHDAGSKAAWDKVFSGKYALPDNGPKNEKNITYSFISDNIFIVGLDQYVNRSRVNQAWLDEQFCKNNQPHVFVFGHEPAFKVRHTDCLDDYPNDRNEFWESIDSEGARIYFAGHDHFYDHARLDDGDGNLDNDLHQYIVGHGGAPLYDDPGVYNGDNGLWMPQRIDHQKAYGYVLVVVDDLDVTVTNKLRASPGQYQMDDEFTYTVSMPSNQAPCTDAGSGRTITLPEATVALNGKVIDDGLPDPPAFVSTAWHVESGPAAVIIEDDSVPETMATFIEAGTYVLRLTADDGELTAGDKTSIVVNPESNSKPESAPLEDEDDDGGGCFTDAVKN